jgi:hypothetical protein
VLFPTVESFIPINHRRVGKQKKQHNQTGRPPEIARLAVLQAWFPNGSCEGWRSSAPIGIGLARIGLSVQERVGAFARRKFF